VENRLRELVCGGQMPLEQAQEEKEANRISAYRRHMP
jgi:hypothetical protein